MTSDVCSQNERGGEVLHSKDLMEHLLTFLECLIRSPCRVSSCLPCDFISSRSTDPLLLTFLESLLRSSSFCSSVSNRSKDEFLDILRPSVCRASRNSASRSTSALMEQLLRFLECPVLRPSGMVLSCLCRPPPVPCDSIGTAVSSTMFRHFAECCTIKLVQSVRLL